MMDFFAGYSYLRTNAAQGVNVPAGNLNGGLGSFSFNANEYIAGEAEFGFYHNNGQIDNTSETYLFGPRLSLGRSKKFDPFIHVLFGGIHTGLKVSNASPLIPPHPVQPLPTPSNGSYSASQANFAMVAGGGVDVHFTKHGYLRLAELDYLLTRFEAPNFLTPTGATSNRNQNNFRFSAGIGFDFGAR